MAGDHSQAMNEFYSVNNIASLPMRLRSCCRCRGYDLDPARAFLVAWMR